MLYASCTIKNGCLSWLFSLAKLQKWQFCPKVLLSINFQHVNNEMNFFLYGVMKKYFFNNWISLRDLNFFTLSFPTWGLNSFSLSYPALVLNLSILIFPNFFLLKPPSIFVFLIFLASKSRSCNGFLLDFFFRLVVYSFDYTMRKHMFKFKHSSFNAQSYKSDFRNNEIIGIPYGQVLRIIQINI